MKDFTLIFSDIKKSKYFISFTIILVAIIVALFVYYWGKINIKITPPPPPQIPLSVENNPYKALGTVVDVNHIRLIIKNIPIDKDAGGELIFNKDISETSKQQTRIYNTKTDINKIFANYKSYLKTQKLTIISEISKDNYKYFAATTGSSDYILTVNINRNKELGISEVSVSLNYSLYKTVSKNLK